MKKLLLGLAPLVLTISLHAQSFPDGPGRKTFEDTCGGCHGADIVVGQQGTKDRWQDTVDSMRSKGAAGSDADFVSIVNYLAKYFGVAVNVNKADPKSIASDLDLTDAAAAAVVEYRSDQKG